MRIVPQKGGWLEVVCGSMFCGKSEELIRRVLRASIAKQKTIIFKPVIDDRYHTNKVVSHIGRSADCVPVASPEELLAKVGDAEVIGIDEVQFFPDTIIEVIQDLVRDGRRVIVAGLDMDFRGEPFGPMPELLARAEFVDKFQAICVVCSGPATRTQRLLDGKPAPVDAPLVQIGAQEAYEARCRGCHKLGPAIYSN